MLLFLFSSLALITFEERIGQKKHLEVARRKLGSCNITTELQLSAEEQRPCPGGSVVCEEVEAVILLQLLLMMAWLGSSAQCLSSRQMEDGLGPWGMCDV